MSLKETIKTVANRGGELIQSQRDDILNDAEARLRKITDDLAARIRASLLTAASIITAGLLILAAIHLFRH